ncbi:MAG: two-component regulator propeller domain-containing protein [Fluviicola sp.]
MLVLSFSSKESFAQNPLHKQLTISNGFFSNTIYDIYQDKKGFIWFATEDGLARFDGLNYKIYPVKNNKSYSFSNILETSDGRIWLQNFYGQFFFTKNYSLIYNP